MTRSWIGRAVLLSFWIFSAWYLYVGGLLTKTLGFSESIVAIAIANIIFALIFAFYAGAGKPKDILFNEAFGKNVSRYFISLLPTLSQIGWYAVVLEIGVTALALMFGLKRNSPLFYLILLVYGAFTIWIAQGKLRPEDAGRLSPEEQNKRRLSRINKLSYASIPAMLCFIIWGAHTILGRLGISGLLTNRLADNSLGSIATGIQILLASFISAAVVMPDFLHDLGGKKNVFLAAFWGLVPTALLVGGIGAAFAIIGKSYDVLATMRIISGPILVYALLAVDNLCGAQAVFPVGTGFASIFSGSGDTPGKKESSRKFWTVAGGLVSVALAMIGVVGHLDIWLKILGVAFAPIIGVVIANQYMVKRDFSTEVLHWPALFAWALGCGVSFVPFGVPILNALATAFIAFVLITKPDR